MVDIGIYFKCPSNLTFKKFMDVNYFSWLSTQQSSA